MDINKIEKDFKYRFKFELSTLNPYANNPIITFSDTKDGMIYKIEMLTAISLETILENIIKEKRDNKIKNILT